MSDEYDDEATGEYPIVEPIENVDPQTLADHGENTDNEMDEEGDE